MWYTMYLYICMCTYASVIACVQNSFNTNERLSYMIFCYVLLQILKIRQRLSIYRRFVSSQKTLTVSDY